MNYSLIFSGSTQVTSNITLAVFILQDALSVQMDNASIVVFIPQSRTDPSGRTWANLCSSSSLLCVTNHGNGHKTDWHKTYYGSRQTILRKASWTTYHERLIRLDAECVLCPQLYLRRITWRSTKSLPKFVQTACDCSTINGQYLCIQLELDWKQYGQFGEEQRKYSEYWDDIS